MISSGYAAVIVRRKTSNEAVKTLRELKCLRIEQGSIDSVRLKRMLGMKAGSRGKAEEVE